MTALGGIRAGCLVFGTGVMVVAVIIILADEALFHLTHNLSLTSESTKSRSGKEAQARVS